ncbi:AAA family ATPase [Mycobacterium asiaticum]|uniref:HTH luxR-type domain-containing protein n=1 Tax=Mycobacterium asiaticum TaxID=1790 RepID=A0A1A3KIA2_MYCAS|nr:LuxR family transcriptional regulator [Mycobacterium asiaticum]OBJ84857.1 hypothetical protein A5640_14395 [Mycobacterium asiaticum]
MDSAARRLFGRDREFAELRRFLDGEHAAMMLRGDAGIGKTALLDVIAATARAAGWRVQQVRGVQFESSIPLAGLSQLVLPYRDLVAELGGDAAAALGPALGHDTANPPSTLAMGTALLDVLTLAGSRERVLIVVDDAHWLDELSATVVSIAAQRLRQPGVRLIAACRSDTPTVLNRAGWRTLDVAGLDDQAAREFLRSLPDTLTVSAERAVLEQAAGNPLALEELPRQVRHSEDGTAPAGIALSDRLQAIFGARIGPLDQHTRQELLRAALDGAGAGGTHSGCYVMRGVEAATEHGLLVIGADGEPVFRHPLVRTAVIQQATPNERRAAHAYLAQCTKDPLRRAVHLSVATVDPDQTVADQLVHAAELSIRRGGARSAVGLLRRAAELSKRPARRAELMAEAAFVAGQAGQLEVTVELASQQPDGASAVGRVNSAMTAAYVELYLQGDVVAGHRRLMGALRDAGAVAALDDATLTRAVNVLLAISQYAGNRIRWDQTDAIVDAVAHRIDPLSLIYRDAWGDFAYRGETVQQRLTDQLLRLSDLQPWDVMRLAVAGFYAGMLGDFRSAIRELFDREQNDGVVTNAMTMLHMLLLDQMETGQWQQAEETVSRGLELTVTHRHETYEQQFRVFSALLAAGKGETVRARDLAAAVAAWARPRGLGLLLGYCQRAVLIGALADGDYQAAYATATEIAEPGVIPHYSHHALDTLMDLVEAAVHVDRIDDARRHVTAAQTLGLPDISPRLGLLCAGAAAMTAADDDADRKFTEAAKHPAAERFSFEHTRIRLAYGMWLRRQRRYRDAAPVLEAARSSFAQIGAAPWAERAAAELRAAGSTTRRLRGEELSAQELRIAELAAAGLSNREIADRLYLSPRTVGAHLYRIFPKLGIGRRAGLRQALDDLTAQSDT